jgi:hypothetical protein
MLGSALGEPGSESDISRVRQGRNELLPVDVVVSVKERGRARRHHASNSFRQLRHGADIPTPDRHCQQE